ncbi:MAG TPA: Trk system potassium transporter TrkA [Clostridiaceae bacterium]|nr:Trk system potassium transporter TrkA [Clostridiaceae bacterium]
MKVLIVGAGKLGYKLAESLSSRNVQITIMDSSYEVSERLNDQLDVLVVTASGIQVDVLKELDIHTYDLTIAVTESDETNIIICSFSKKLGCKRAIARVRNPEYAQNIGFVKSTMDIDYIINPELDTAKEIIRYLFRSSSFYWADFADGRIVMTDFFARNLPGFVGNKIMDLENINNMLITSINRNGEIIIPDGSSTILEHDIVYVIGEKDSISQLAQRYKVSLPTKYIRKVMILGGGRIGYYLGKRLGEMGISVKIIEKDRERCDYLSEELSNALVICGDGTDINLLKEEDISSMDAFIGVTGFDEENLLMTLMAKQVGVKKTIAKVSKPSYVKIIENLGVDIALSPIDITSSEIVKLVRGERFLSVSLLLGGQAEINEIVADSRMPIIGKRISEMGLPKGVIIGAIEHKGKVIVPNGNSVIHDGDKFVVFCMSSKLSVLDTFFGYNRGGVFSELRNHSKGFGKHHNA